jgi:hypothetical protein
MVVFGYPIECDSDKPAPPKVLQAHPSAVVALAGVVHFICSFPARCIPLFAVKKCSQAAARKALLGYLAQFPNPVG